MSQDLSRFRRHGAEYEVSMRAANTSLANNFVNRLTSLVLEIPDKALYRLRETVPAST